ncbi:hypothetical protein EAF00_003097 [Botryotinia globosa]|nr:hypothetical protein EAF00_003097 [Botryotinia globosa]
MSTKKLLVIFRATGNQGGSVANIFLNTGSTKARALDSRDVEVFQADLDSPDALSLAFENAHAVFAVSDFWGLHGNPANRDEAAKDQALDVQLRRI